MRTFQASKTVPFDQAPAGVVGHCLVPVIDHSLANLVGAVAVYSQVEPRTLYDGPIMVEQGMCPLARDQLGIAGDYHVALVDADNCQDCLPHQRLV